MTDGKVWKLRELLSACGIRPDQDLRDIPIRQVTDDSRVVQKGALFVAVRGARADGHRYLDQAIARGACAVLVEEEVAVPEKVVKLKVKETQPILGPLVHAFLGAPSQRLKVVGVTGTNGKTTVAWLIQQILEAAGWPCGLLGTVCYRFGEAEQPSSNTTPGATALQGMLSEMAAQGLKGCAMEVSSHALDQHRTDGIRWACGVFTNLSSEHLDYHRTLEGYLQAKLRLFEALDSDATAVINRDDPVWERVRASTKGRVLTYSLRTAADLTARKILCSMEGTACELQTPEGTVPFAWGLVGRHNIENLLAAVGAAMSLGVSVRQACEGAARFAGVPGRLERVEVGQPFPVFVDYAHTDGALKSVLEQLRAVTPRKILTVFGCGGDRDRTKRPRIGRVAAELSDRVGITSDNPRSEDPAAIAQEAAAGIKGLHTPWEIVLDRAEAIRLALESADEGWMVLIAGKGHETGQIIGEEIIPFDDRQVVRELLSHVRAE